MTGRLRESSHRKQPDAEFFYTCFDLVQPSTEREFSEAREDMKK